MIRFLVPLVAFTAALLTLLAAVLFWSGAQFVGSMFTVYAVKVLASKIAWPDRVELPRPPSALKAV